MRRIVFVAILILSIGANAWFLVQQSQTPPARPLPRQLPTPPSATSQPASRAVAPPKTLEDYRVLQARLLQDGYTQDFTQKIITNLLQDEWTRRLKSLRPPRKYWRNTHRWLVEDEVEDIKQLHAEMEKMAFDLGAPTPFESAF